MVLMCSHRCLSKHFLHIISIFVSLVSAVSFPGPLGQKHHGPRTGSVLFTKTLTCVTGDRSCRQYMHTRPGSVGKGQAGVHERHQGGCPGQQE